MRIAQPAPWASPGGQPATPPPEPPKRRKAAKRRPVQVRVNRALYLSALADAIQWRDKHDEDAALLRRYRQALATVNQPAKRGARHKLTDGQAQEAAAALRSGEPLARVAKRLGVQPDTVRRAIGRLADE